MHDQPASGDDRLLLLATAARVDEIWPGHAFAAALRRLAAYPGVWTRHCDSWAASANLACDNQDRVHADQYGKNLDDALDQVAKAERAS